MGVCARARVYVSVSVCVHTQAKDTLKFKPEDYGLTDKEAGNIAYAFATYDTNQNFKLEANELRTLW